MGVLELGIISGIGALGGGVSNAIGSSKKANAARQAADVQLQATREGIAAEEKARGESEAFLREFAGIAREDLAPFRESQLGALENLTALADPNSQLFTDARDQGQREIERTLAAQGLLRSGRQGALLSDLESNLFRQRSDLLGRLAGTGAVQNSANISQGLGNNLANLASGSGTKISNLINAGGNARAGGITGAAGASAEGISGINSAFQGGLQNLVTLGLLDKTGLFNNVKTSDAPSTPAGGNAPRLFTGGYSGGRNTRPGGNFFAL